MTERDITICGHGSNTPSLKNLYSYLDLRWNGFMTNKVRKRLLKVRRLKALDTREKREHFHDLYRTILGRNTYDQDRRQYVYTPYKGRYYSDCSSSGCATYQRCGADIPLLNTAGMIGSDLFTDVPVDIVDGHIMQPERLLPGDALLFAGNINRPSLDYVGHVEYIYEVPWVVATGWEHDAVTGLWRYLEKGEPVADAWRYIADRWYVFNGAGYMIADAWYLDSTGAWYFLGKDGAMISGQWLQENGDWFYFEQDGRMASDAFVPDQRGWCYVDGSGRWDGEYRHVLPGPGVYVVGQQRH